MLLAYIGDTLSIGGWEGKACLLGYGLSGGLAFHVLKALSPLWQNSETNNNNNLVAEACPTQ